MTAITFPNSPSSGDTHTAGNGIVYTYDGEKWTSIGTNSAGTWTRSGTEVSLTNAGDDLNVDSGTLFVDASTDRVGVGTSSPGTKLEVSGSAALRTDADVRLTLGSAGSIGSNDSNFIRAATDQVIYNSATSSGRHSFEIAGSEKLRIDSSGNVGIGSTAPQSPLHVNGTGDVAIQITNGTTGTSATDGSQITVENPSMDLVLRNRENATIRFLTNNTESGRFDASGRLLVGTTSASGGASFGNIVLEFAGNSFNGIKTRDTDNTGTVTHMVFVSGSTAVGSITGTTGAASFNNLSDYRKKENDVEITDGIEKVKLLRPIRFNYICDPDTVCDGFFAHEVTPAVPTAVTGVKDAVDAEGKIEPQMLDASKLVPLLTAALQEAIAKIETLEQRLSDAGIA